MEKIYPDPVVVEKPDGSMQLVSMPIRQLLAKFEPQWFPVLRRACEDIQQAHSVKQEWLVETPEAEHDLAAEFNYQQIVHVRFKKLADKEKALTELFARMEEILTIGRRSFDMAGSMPCSTCGGALDFLGRLPEQNDRFALSVLRAPSMYWHPEDGGEWLVEFGLVAWKGD